MNPAAEDKSQTKDQAITTATKITKEAVAEAKEIKLTFPREFSHTVFLRRKKNSSDLPKEGNFTDESIAKIGSGFKNKSVLRGLTHDEEDRWLSSILGLKPGTDNWEKATLNYWTNISKFVPLSDKDGNGGLKLEVGLKYKNIEDYEADQRKIKSWGESNVGGVRQFISIENPKGEPIDLADYILWRYCLVYSKVANSFEEVGNSPKIEFYIFSKEKEIKDKKASFDQKRKASQLLYSRLSDREWVDHLLTLFLQSDKAASHAIRNVSSISDDEKDVMIESYMVANPTLFLAWGNDKSLEIRSNIERWIAAGILTRISNTNSISFEGNTIGNTMEETITFLKNEKNSFVLGQLRAQYNTKP